MEEDHVDSSDEGESVYDFVRRGVARDRVAEANARKALVNGLVGRVVKTDLTTRPGSVIMPKRGRPVSRGTSDGEDILAEQALEKPKAQEEKVQEKSPQRAKSPKPPKQTRRSVLEQIGNIQLVAPASKPKPVEIVAQPQLPVLKEKRTIADQKLRALTEAACEHGVPRNLKAVDLIAEAALKLRIPVTAMNAHWGRYVSPAQKDLLLYGEGGKKITRAEEKFAILLRVRAKMREKKEPKPRKKELALAAAKPLGMTLNSTRTYIYDRLTQEQVEQLDLQGQFLTLEEQIVILKRIRKEMKDKGLPKPRQVDLAEAAAKELRQTVDSVRTLIVSLSDEVKTDLEFTKTRSRTFVGLGPRTIRNGFIGAFNVLKLRKLPATFENLRLILQMKPGVINAYLSERPELLALLVDEKKT